MDMPVREWHGWIFVDPNRQGPDFDQHIGELEDILARYDAETLVTAETHEYDVAANWKVIIENYQECYHCSLIHPELCKVSPPYSGENLEREGNWVGGWMALAEGAETMSLSGESKGTVIARLDEEEQHTVMYIAVMPNLLISLHPDYIMTHLLTPIDADTTHIKCSWAFPPRRASSARASTRHTPSISGTSPTVRTGRRASRCSAASRRPASTRPARSRRGRRLPLRDADGAAIPG